jgi:hypothetical protein
VVVVGAANVGVNRQVGRVQFFFGQWQRQLIQPLLQDRCDALVAGRVNSQRTATGLFKAVAAVATAEV